MSWKMSVPATGMALLVLCALACSSALVVPNTLDPLLSEAQEFVAYYCELSAGSDWVGVDDKALVRLNLKEEGAEGTIKGKCAIIAFRGDKPKEPQFYKISAVQEQLPAELRADKPAEAETFVLEGHTPVSKRYNHQGRSVTIEGETVTVRVVERKTRKVLAEFKLGTRLDDPDTPGPRSVDTKMIADKVAALKRQ